MVEEGRGMTKQVVWVIISEGDQELKVLEDYQGPLPQVGQTLTFLSGEGIFIVNSISWRTSKENWYTFYCNIGVERKKVGE